MRRTFKSWLDVQAGRDLFQPYGFTALARDVYLDREVGCFTDDLTVANLRKHAKDFHPGGLPEVERGITAWREARWSR